MHIIIRSKSVQKTEQPFQAERLLLCCNWNLACLRSLNGTYASASAAIQTCVCVDYVLVIALRDCGCRTFLSTCTTADASVSDLICHYDTPPLGFQDKTALYIILYHIYRKNQALFDKKRVTARYRGVFV
jgi:hypothetical protein